MDLKKACEVGDMLRELLGRVMMYRGYRPAAVAYTGLWAIIGSAVEFLFLLEGRPSDHVQLWVGIAIASAVPVAAHMFWEYHSNSDSHIQKDTRDVVSRFVGCIAAGGIATATLTGRSEDILALLPGLWAMLFSLGIFASQPYLPKPLSQAGHLYLIAGGGLLLIARASNIAPFLVMGPIFMFGQLLTARILYRYL